jgi:hypothetical protein
MNIGAPELAIVAALGIVPLIVGIVTAVDANRFPETAFRRVGTSRTLWIVLPLVLIVACGAGTIVAAIVWFASYRPKVAQAAAEGTEPSPPLPPPV